MSVLLLPPPSMADPGWLTALGAVAVAEVVASVFGLHARIKWPNDVRVDRRKLAGILVERGQGTVLGIGLNVNVDLDDFPEALRESATSLQRLVGRPLDRSEVARSLIRRLDFHHAQAVANGPDSLNDHYRSRSEHLGHEIELRTSTETIIGKLIDINLQTGLTMTLSDGHVRKIPGRDVAVISNQD